MKLLKKKKLVKTKYLGLIARKQVDYSVFSMDHISQ